jgi:general secretion pathway protein A
MIQEKDVFEEIRLISNLQLEDRFMVTIIFIGQPELREMMERIPQLKQRLAITHHLGPLSREETGTYIRHRLRVAGGREDIFTSEAIRCIYESSAGIPRKINTICDICLVIGSGEKAKAIDEEIVKGVVKNMV